MGARIDGKLYYTDFSKTESTWTSWQKDLASEKARQNLDYYSEPQNQNAAAAVRDNPDVTPSNKTEYPAWDQSNSSRNNNTSTEGECYGSFLTGLFMLVGLIGVGIKKIILTLVRK